MNEAQRDVALFRYSMIREPADESLTVRQRGRLVRELAGRDHAGPNDRRVRVARGTIDRWIRAYRAGGFEALAPVSRTGEPVTEQRLLDLAEALKREVPRRTAAQVAQIIRTAEGAGPSARTLQRHFARLGLNTRPDGSPPEAFGRLEAAFRSALASRGVPRRCYVDNGSAYISKQLLRACASLGVRLVHSKPGRPEGRGKIERVFETVRIQFLVEVEARPPQDLAELNRLFSAWVETVYHRRRHTETGEAPIDRLLAAGPPPLPTPAALHEAFLWSETRTVTKTATISLHGNAFEVDAALVGSRVEVIFDPFDMETVEIRFQGRSMGAGVPVSIGRHSHPKARPEAAPEPAPTGIDYLGLLAQRRQAELAESIIDYSQLSLPSNEPPIAQDNDNDKEIQL